MSRTSQRAARPGGALISAQVVQTLLEAARGMLALPDLLAGLGLGALGLCGLVCAWAACGPDATDADGN